MLQGIRGKTQGVLSWTVIILISAAFTLTGVTSIFYKNANVVAEVNGKDVTWDEVNRELRHYLLSSNIDVNEIPKEQFEYLKREIVNVLVQRKALLNDTENKGLSVDEKQVLYKIAKNELFTEDGKFSKEKYSSFLKNIGYNDKVFRKEIKQDMLLSQYRDGLSLSNFSDFNDLKNIIRSLFQKRDVKYATFQLDDFIDENIVISEEEIAESYEQNKHSFIADEQVKLEFVKLSIKDIEKEVNATQEILKEFYTSNQDKYVNPRKMKVRHILLNYSEDEAGTIEKLQKIKDEITSQKITFEEAVALYSEDEDTKAKSGEIGWIDDEDITKEIYQKVASVDKNEISEPVKTIFGFHLVKVTDIQDAKQLTFEQAKPKVEKDYKYEQAENIFSEKLEELTNLAFENPDNLDVVAKSLNLKLNTTDFFDKQGGTTEVTTNANVVKEAFQKESIENKQNSDLIKLDDENYLVIRVSDSKPVYQKTLEEVKSDVRQALVLAKAKVKLKEAVNDSLEKLKNGEPQNTVFANYKNVEWTQKENLDRNSKTINAELLRKVFSTGVSVSAKFDSIALNSGDYMIYSVTKVEEGDLSKVTLEEQKKYAQGLQSNMNVLEYSLYNNELLLNSKINYNLR